MSALVLRTARAEETRSLAGALAPALRPGDVLVLDGPLGAGKTTFTQGLGAGLGVRGPVASPTFVIARVHPGLRGGPALVHVDAYRLAGGGDIDDLDLEADIDEAVTVVEWGRDRVEHLSDSSLLVELERPDQVSDPDQPDEPRQVRLTPRGPRWDPTARRVLAEALAAAGFTADRTDDAAPHGITAKGAAAEAADAAADGPAGPAHPASEEDR